MSCRSISAAAAVALLFVSATASAQVYKCSEGGKTVFSDRPCGEAASRVDVRPSTGSYDPDAAARIRSQTENVNSRFDAEERARDRARQAAAALGITLATYQRLERGAEWTDGAAVTIDRRTALACAALAAGLSEWSLQCGDHRRP